MTFKKHNHNIYPIKRKYCKLSSQHSDFVDGVVSVSLCLCLYFRFSLALTDAALFKSKFKQGLHIAFG